MIIDVPHGACAQVSFFFCGADLSAGGQLQGKIGHILYRLGHMPGIVFRADDVAKTAVKLCSGVLFKKARNGRDLQLLAHGSRNGTTGKAVTPCIEPRACNKQIRLEGGYLFHHLCGNGFQILCNKIVPAADGAHYLSGISQELVDEQAGAHGLFLDHDAHTGGIFAAELSIELVDIVYDSQLFSHHEASSIR